MKEKVPYPEIPFLVIDESINESKRVPLNELFKMTTFGKLFFAGLAAWIMHRSSKLKIKGSPREIDAIANAIQSSRAFQDEIKKPGATIDSVMEKLKLKYARGEEFERILGVPFPL